MSKKAMISMMLALVTSPLTTWQEMIKDIYGDHYYLTSEQYNFILKQYESEAIPTLPSTTPRVSRPTKNIGFPGNDVIRKELETACK